MRKPSRSNGGRIFGGLPPASASTRNASIESLSKLERTKENLDRTQDILSELERQVSPLKRQARKAEIYREKKARLQEIEIAVLVEEITHLNQQIDEAVKTLFDIENSTTMQQTTIQFMKRPIWRPRRIPTVWK